MKNSLKRGDVVVVIAGNDKGKTGKVLSVVKGGERVVIEGVAVAKRHLRKTQEHPDGAIVEKFQSVHISNVMLKVIFDARLTKRNKNA
jgi:large subunit ribosomal protein L24